MVLQTTKILSVTGMTACLMVGCGKPATGNQQPIIRIDGSSTVYLLSAAVAEEYERQHGAMITIGISGTGGGMAKICTGEVDITGASRLINESELALCERNGIELLELPTAYDGITLVTHIDNDWVDHLSVEELRSIWEPEAQNQIERWSQVRSGFPDLELDLYGPGSASGTLDYFTEVIVGERRSSRPDYAASEDDNVLVQGVRSNRNALGYFGYAYFEANRDRLRAIPIGNDPVQAVLPTQETISNLNYRPLSRPLFIYVNANSIERHEVNDFVAFYLANSGTLAADVGYVRLPTDEGLLAARRLEDRELKTR